MIFGKMVHPWQDSDSMPECSNIKDHEKLLLDNWREQHEAVKKIRSLNRKYKEFKEKRLKAIRQELK